jgi:hypothetical protein
MCVELNVGVCFEVIYALRNAEVRSCNHCSRGKAVGIAYYESVFLALGISMICACAMSYVACPVLQYFSTLSHKRHEFQK